MSDNLEHSILTRKKFSALVENRVMSHKLLYMDAIIELCEEYNLDPSDMNKYLSNIVKDKLEAEAINLRCIKSNSHKLPI